MAAIVITGAAGMVGSHLLERLASSGAGPVVGSYFRPTIRIEDIAGRFDLRELDVRHAEPVRRLIAHERPATIYNLAGRACRCGPGTTRGRRWRSTSSAP